MKRWDAEVHVVEWGIAPVFARHCMSQALAHDVAWVAPIRKSEKAKKRRGSATSLNLSEVARRERLKRHASMALIAAYAGSLVALRRKARIGNG
jgi:hypothetical protein